MMHNNLNNQLEKNQSKATLTPQEIQKIISKYPKRNLALARSLAQRKGISLEQLIATTRQKDTKPGFNRELYEKRGCKFKIPLKTQQLALVDLAKSKITGLNQQDVAKKHNISISSLFTIYNKNKDRYNEILKELSERVKNRALLAAEMGLKCVKKKEFKKLNVLQISQASKNFNDIFVDKHETPTVNINIPIPESREKLVQMILDTEPVSSPTVNPTDNIT